MMGLKTLLLASLLGVLEGMFAAGSHQHGFMPGSPYNISKNDRSLQQIVLIAAHSFNNQSNDAFLFRPSAIHRAQRQVVKGILYIVDLEISRTVCRKRDSSSNLSTCDFQPEGDLQQTFECHVELWVISWQKKTKIQVLTCKP